MCLSTISSAGLSSTEQRRMRWQALEVSARCWHGYMEVDVKVARDSDTLSRFEAVLRAAGGGSAVSVTEAKRKLRQHGPAGQALAARVSRLSKARNSSAHPDATLEAEIVALMSTSDGSESEKEHDLGNLAVQQVEFKHKKGQEKKLTAKAEECKGEVNTKQPSDKSKQSLENLKATDMKDLDGEKASRGKSVECKAEVNTKQASDKSKLTLENLVSTDMKDLDEEKARWAKADECKAEVNKQPSDISKQSLEHLMATDMKDLDEERPARQVTRGHHERVEKDRLERQLRAFLGRCERTGLSALATDAAVLVAGEAKGKWSSPKVLGTELDDFIFEHGDLAGAKFRKEGFALVRGFAALPPPAGRIFA